MVKSNTCPVCEGKALDSVRQLFSKKDYIECAKCGTHIDHSWLVIVLISLVVLILYVLAIDSFMDMELPSVLFITFGIFLVWWVAIWIFVPLVPIKEKPAANTTLKWYQLPVIWLGVPVLLLIVWSLVF